VIIYDDTHPRRSRNFGDAALASWGKSTFTCIIPRIAPLHGTRVRGETGGRGGRQKQRKNQTLFHKNFSSSDHTQQNNPSLNGKMSKRKTQKRPFIILWYIVLLYPLQFLRQSPSRNPTQPKVIPIIVKANTTIGSVIPLPHSPAYLLHLPTYPPPRHMSS